MVREIRIYVEGGGDRATDRADLRKGFGKFLDGIKQQARAKRIGWNIKACGSRGMAFKSFKSAIQQKPEAFNVLLIDSEGPVEPNTPSWKHLREREEDKWELSAQYEPNCYLMVQTMEAWFLADKMALAAFYGNGFNQNALPDRSDVEQIAKQDIYDSLKRATRDTGAKEYHKTRHAPKILGLLNVAKVRKAALHCKQLFQVLEKQVGISIE